jgi:hypothetical protein
MALLVLACAGLAPCAQADDAPVFVIHTAHTELHNGVYYLDADMRLQLDNDAANALMNGVPLVLKIEIEVTRQRAFLWDPTVAQLTQSYELTYHALSRRFIVSSLNSGRQTSFDSYQAALAHLGYISNLPVLDASLLNGDGQYGIRIRSLLDIKIIPTGFQLITSLFSGAEQATDWYQWALRK